jgi:hypothetical protein
MATAPNIRDISRRLEAEVAAHGCGRLSCYCEDVEEALAPVPASAAQSSAGSAASARRVSLAGHFAVVEPDAIERQEAVFGGQLADY